MFRNQAALIVTAFVALAANACATREARPVSALAVACPGGTVHSAVEAAGYAACDTVQGDLTIASSDLEDMSALSRLHEVTGTLTITGNPELDDLGGLENLRRVGMLEVSHNPELKTLSGLDALTEADSVVIRANGIYTARGLGELRQVGDLIIEGNHKLNSLSGVRSLKRARSVTIQNNPILCAIGMLPALDGVDSRMLLRANRGISTREAKLVLERAGQSNDSPAFANAAGSRIARR